MIARKLMALATAVLLALGAGAAQADITVGGKNFTEQLLLAEMTAIYLEDKGYEISKREGMGSAVLRRAQENGQVDIYWEYVGTSLIVYNKVEGGAEMAPEEAYRKVKALDAEKGLIWLKPSAANNTYALAMRNADARKLGISTLSGLVERVKTKGDMTIAINSEWAGRPDGLPGFQKHYDVRWPRDKIRRMQTGLVYTALKEGQVQVGLVFATDGRIAAFDFAVLQDDKNFFPNYALTPVIRTETLKANPELREQLNKLSAKLDAPTMQSLNQRVDVERETVEAVAKDFLKSEGLI
jgi:osmoprotectant transport system substrate-binding protein